MSRLYLLEFFVTELNLFDQIIRDAGDATFAIRISFVDFPSFEINRRNVSSARVDPPRIKSCLDFGAGYACHFTIPPDILLKKIIRHPLSLKIFRKGDSFPICLAELPLSGCLCDQAKTDVDFPLPKPYVFGGIIGLVDVGGNPSGNVNIVLRIIPRGKYVIASFLLKENGFLFKDDSQGSTEFEVRQEDGKDEVGAKKDNTTEEIPWVNHASDVAVIFPSAGNLSLIKQTQKSARVLLAKIEVEEMKDQEKINVKKEKTKDKRKKNKKQKK